jgi:hypothetical protein
MERKMGRINSPFSRYFTQLDSALTANKRFRRADEITWWLPNEEERTNALVTGSTRVMYRFLFGDILTLPRNQAFDSPLFFSMADELLKVEGEWINLSLLTEKEPSLELFVNEVAERFKEKSFLLSAWPGLDEAQRERIYLNIKETGSFDRMLDQVGEISGEHLDTFLRQQETLQKLLHYLQKHPEFMKQSATNIHKKNRSLWNRISDPHILDQLGPHAQILKKIPRKIGKTGNLNNRGMLYKGIEEYPDDIRYRIKNVIDQQYYYILADSVAGGKIDLSIAPLPEESLSDHFNQIHAGDQQNDATGIRSIHAHIEVDDEPSVSNLGTLNWEDMRDILNDSDVQQAINRFRKKAVIYRGHETQRIQELVNEHMDALTKLIPDKIYATSDNEVLSAVLPFSDKTITLNDAQNKRLINIITAILPGGIKELTRDGAKALFKGFQKRNMRDKRIMLAGHVRDWLTSEVEKGDASQKTEDQ